MGNPRGDACRAPCARLLALSFLVSSIAGGSAQSLDPIDVGIDSSVTDNWWFWLIIAVIGCFFIVSFFFVLRGFRNYRRYKQELEKQQQLAEEQEAQAPSAEDPCQEEPAGKAKDIELGLTAAPSVTTESSSFYDDGELARRTGSKPRPASLSASRTARF